MSDEEYMALIDYVHHLMGDFCNKVDDDEPGNVACFDVADGLWRKGYRLVGNEEARDG